MQIINVCLLYLSMTRHSLLRTVLEFEVLPNCQIAIFLVSMRKGEVWEPYTFIPLDDTICISILS